MDAKGREVPPAPTNAEAAKAPPPAAAETLAEAPRRRAGGAKRKASTPSPSSAPSKRHAKERNPIHNLTPVHNGPCTRARQTTHKHAAATSHKPPEHALAEAGGKDASAAGGRIKAEDAVMVEEPVVDVEFEAVRSRGANVHAVPVPAGWFSWKMIHPLEKHMLPSFFNGKSENRTPEVYMEIRNSIMKKFHADPQSQVELKDFSELSIGDMDARQEVMEFLDHWGLINFHPFPPSKPNDSKSDDDNGFKTSSLVDQLFQFETIQSFPHFSPKKEGPLVPVAPTCLLPELALADDLVRPVGPSVEYHCNSCSADCSRKRYHCQKQADFDLCNDCYNDGKFGSGMAPADFILMESAEVPGVSGGSWTDQETLLLLEALELFGERESWNDIAEHVATKTKAQCIFHFLQMPIEDSFLEGDHDVNNNNQDNKDQSTNTPELMEVDKKEAKEESSPSDAHEVETKKVENSDNVDHPIASEADALVNKSTADVYISDDSGASFAIDALRTAFQAVGCFPGQEEFGSFAEAGNPVMALAAFLSGLVESDAVITSLRSSLKAMSEDSPGIQLATRHCFLLENPPNDRKDLPASMSATTETNDKESDNGDSKMPINESKEQNQLLENDRNSSISSPKQIDEKETHDVTPLDAMPNIIQDSGDQSLSGEEGMASNVKDATDAALSVECTPNTTKAMEDLASQVENIESLEKKISSSKSVEEKPNSMKNSDEMASTDKVQPHPSSTEAADKISTSVVLEEDCLQTAGDNLADESKTEADGDERKELLSNDEKTFKPDGSSDDHNIGRLKRAAVTAISAAAVKAKLLVELEENEIRKLVSLIIEKQLHKLEGKLELFTGIERMVMRMREETEKARHRLVHQRSLILAARLGVPASSLRANTASLPTNRLAMAYGATGPKPLNMAMQRSPPVRRP